MLVQHVDMRVARAHRGPEDRFVQSAAYFSRTVIASRATDAVAGRSARRIPIRTERTSAARTHAALSAPIGVARAAFTGARTWHRMPRLDEARVVGRVALAVMLIAGAVVALVDGAPAADLFATAPAWARALFAGAAAAAGAMLLVPPTAIGGALLGLLVVGGAMALAADGGEPSGLAAITVAFILSGVQLVLESRARAT